MILSLKGETATSEDMIAHIEEILISVRLAFLNCFLDFAGKPFTPNFCDNICIQMRTHSCVQTKETTMVMLI